MVEPPIARLQRHLSQYLSNHRIGKQWLLYGCGLLLVVSAISGGWLQAATRIPNAVLVDMQAIAPTVQLDVRYATAQNFTHQKLYSHPRCLLRPAVAMRLAKVQADLQTQGLGLKVFDCYRPLSVQRKMWKIVPNPLYVANPQQGSRHNRGSAVDLTLVDRNGKELPMPSAFDEFSPKSHLDYRGDNPKQIQNRDRLQQVMKRRGFQPILSEWWHFDAPNWQQYPLLDLPLSTGLS